MSNKAKFSMVVAFCACASHVAGQESGLPNIEILERKHATDGRTIQVEPLDPEDFAPKERNQISVQDSIEISLIAKSVDQALGKIPEEDPRRSMNDFKRLENISKSFQEISTTKSRFSFFDTISSTLAVVSSNEERGIEISSAVGRLSDVRYAYIREMEFEVSEKSADVTQESQSRFIDLFCNSVMVQEPDWENHAMPIDSAGIFITNHDRAAEILKQKNLEGVEFYLAGHTDNSFFERYEAAGDGMPILKSKFAANKAAIQSKLAEVLAHAAALEAANLEK